MVKTIFVPVLVVIVIVVLLYLNLNPAKQPGTTIVIPDAPMAMAIDGLAILAPQSEVRKIEQVRNDLSVISNVVHAIKTDAIGCIVPSKKEFASLEENVKLILPESGAFSLPTTQGATMGDAIIGHQNLIKQNNQLLEIVKKKEERIVAILTEIELVLDHKGDAFKTRFARKASKLLQLIEQAKSDVISQCSKQRSRMRTTHPHLSYYEFIDESVHSKANMPAYVYGTSVSPVIRTNANDNPNDKYSSAQGLIKEFFHI